MTRIPAPRPSGQQAPQAGAPQRTAPRPGDAPPPSPFRNLGERFDAALLRGIGHITRRALGAHQTAVVRIGFAVTVLVFLVREWPHRHELYGPDSPWGYDLATRFVDSNGAFTILLWSDALPWFELIYHLTMAACVALLLGWRTRASSMLFMIGVLSLQNRSVFMGDGGDNVIKLMALYLVLTRCGQVWSLDARRRARRAQAGRHPTDDPVGIALWAVLGALLLAALLTGKLDSPVWAAFFAGMWLVHGFWWLVRRHAPGEPRIVADILGNLTHNAALLVIMAEVCIIYSTAGWYKIQGSRWQDGTASYYPMELDYFNAWPELSGILTGSGLIVTALTYGTVFMQVAFPFTLLNRRAKNVLIVLLMGEHIGIAVLLGLPFFSMAMIAMDSVFLPTAFLLWLGSRSQRATEPVRRRLRRNAPGAAAVPAQAGPAPAAASTGGRPPAWAEK
ncbi:HTTM domain-containing protein [Streptomyces sp. DSM 44917]|uniref:HTTM domain-containing protein n=1 Tax=Streptomyces boetiae TaxID=3075541 RepID=A0ABU2L6B0_9ACTN|nr:HTTM domain-containing protein [Streptomyces sp. DSM 44917]MDT0307094.1 HTTM domain-containing protein [Streptomyces sp. DSM 44917]